jgi:hypothetical protein
MKFINQPNVLPEINAQSEKDINAVNAYIDGLKGTVISVQSIRAGQAAPYQDTVYESLIFCHQPNVMTTNSPSIRIIDIEQAKAIARIFVCNFDDTPKDWASPKLQFIRPEANPCGLKELDAHKDQGLYSCWRVRVTLAFTGLSRVPRVRVSADARAPATSQVRSETRIQENIVNKVGTIVGPFRVVKRNKELFKGYPYYVAIDIPSKSPDACYLRANGEIKLDCCDDAKKIGANSGWFATMEDVEAAIRLYEEKGVKEAYAN